MVEPRIDISKIVSILKSIANITLKNTHSLKFYPFKKSIKVKFHLFSDNCFFTQLYCVSFMQEDMQ